MSTLTPEQYQQFLSEHDRIIALARQAAPAYLELLESEGTRGWQCIDAIDERNHPSIEFTAEEIEFSADITRRGDTEREYFSIPTAFLLDPDGFSARYRAEQEEARRQAEAEAARREAERRAQQEAAERAQLQRLLAKYGTPEADHDA